MTLSTMKNGHDRKALARRLALRKKMGKGELHSVYKALKHHKKIPHIKDKIYKKNPEYAKLSIEEYESKYPDMPTTNAKGRALNNKRK